MSARGPDQLAISIITVAELQDGASQLKDDERRRFFLDWLETDIVEGFKDRILPLTRPILTDWLSLSRKLGLAGQPRSAPDVLIAATARAHDLIVVSRNVRDFTGTDTIVYNPWTGETRHMAD
jgi:predicted nucleic acid-binding protein